MWRLRHVASGFWVLGFGLWDFVSARRLPRRTLRPCRPIPARRSPISRRCRRRSFAACTGVRTLEAELSLSGRAGEQRLRGRVIAGFERPASMRLEGVAPFGAPAFILVARGDTAMLLLPRDGARRPRRTRRSDARRADRRGAGAGGPAGDPHRLRRCRRRARRRAACTATAWRRSTCEGGATLYLQRTGSRLACCARRGATAGRSSIRRWQGSFPRPCGCSPTAPAVDVDLTATLSQLETNVDLDCRRRSRVEIPAMPAPMTLDELRDAGPLRGSRSERGAALPRSVVAPAGAIASLRRGARCRRPARAARQRRRSSATTSCRSYPHDPEAFTQGLIYRDGFLFESTGLNGRSSLRKVRLETGEVVQQRSGRRALLRRGADRLGQPAGAAHLARPTSRFVYDLATFSAAATRSPIRAKAGG